MKAKKIVLSSVVFAFASFMVLAISSQWQFLAVQSGSMAPAIKKGSLIIIKPSKEYSPGEVIAFSNSGVSRQLIIHRVKGIETKDGLVSFITQGDANKAPDSKKAASSWVKGKMILAIPVLGYLVSFSKTLPGLLLLVILPAALIIFNEIKKAYHELAKN